MLNVENNIIHWLTGKDNLKEVSVSELKGIVNNYPYFTVAQLLLTLKLKQEASPEYEHQLQKTALSFQDPQWLHFQIDHLNYQEEEESSPADTSEPVAAPQTKEEETPTDNNISEAIPAAETISGTSTTDTLTTEAESPKETATENTEEQATEEPMEENSRLSSILEKQAAAFKAEVSADSPLPIATPAPLHTRDYFASQGIHLNASEVGELGQKVRKFTDWLRQMKSISPHPTDLGSTPMEEQEVKHDAEVSNKEAEVLTEAMAEVLSKQGKKEEAISVLEKLSLQKPEKSAYFASKINLLKEN